MENPFDKVDSNGDDAIDKSETDSLSSTDPLDTNGDGIVDAKEAESGSNYYIQEYVSHMFSTLSQGSQTGSQLSLQV